MECMNNARQIGLAFMMYNMDENGYFPYFHDGTEVSMWIRYGGENGSTFEALRALPPIKRPVNSYVGEDRRIFRCPSEKKISCDWPNWPWMHMGTSYAANL